MSGQQDAVPSLKPQLLQNFILTRPELFGHCSRASESREISVAELVGIRVGHLERSGVERTPDFRMAIAEVEAETEIVAMPREGGEIKPRNSRGVGDEEAVVNAAFVFVDDHPAFRGSREIGIFCEKTDISAGGVGNGRQAGVACSHETVHRVTPQGRGKFALACNALISWTVIRGDVLNVVVKPAFLDEIGIHRVGGIGHVPLDPDFRTFGKRWDEVPIVIRVVHLPGKTQLTQVGKTSGTLRFDFRFAQDGQKQGSQDGNGPYNGQEFN